ncbi:methionine synthase [Nocardioides sp. HDW12B]|uniref:methionine synthase n=1 Tax=Nocardioides sp. HDW12B TaxID=2714939 RepID=UPI00140A2F41|nr:methionine synthase [Nocardioides sp. HDW12B]QIK67063.1 methionine synthase [Nocardioides sp. HDW12B]
MTRASGVGSHPGEDQRAYDDAVEVVLADLPDPAGLTYVPEVPGRGAPAGMVGRTLALLDGLGVDLQPAGWRVTDAPGIDHRRAVSLLGQDLDTVEERLQGFTGVLKLQVTGPWTLAATVERPRGDRVLADHGLRRELAQSLAAGLDDHLAATQRRVPGATLLLQVDEPALPAVLAGQVPTASGFHRHRTVDAPAAAPLLDDVLGAAHDAGLETLVHCCADDVPFDLLGRVGDGRVGLSVDLDRLDAAAYDEVAAALEADRWTFLGAVPSTRPETEPTVGDVVRRVERLLDMLGLEPTDRLVLTPACGLAGADPRWARTALRLCAEAARQLS